MLAREADREVGTHLVRELDVFPVHLGLIRCRHGRTTEPARVPDVGSLEVQSPLTEHRARGEVGPAAADTGDHCRGDIPSSLPLHSGHEGAAARHERGAREPNPWRKPVCHEERTQRRLDARRLKGRRPEPIRTGAAEDLVRRAARAARVARSLDQQVDAGVEDVGRKPHEERIVPQPQRVAPQTGPDKRAGPEAAQIAEPDPAIRPVPPEIGGGPVAAEQRGTAALHLDHGLRPEAGGRHHRRGEHQGEADAGGRRGGGR